MMKAGYDEFFRKARVNAGVSSSSGTAKFALRQEDDVALAQLRQREKTSPKGAVKAPRREQISAQDLNKERIHQLREKVKARRQGRRRQFPLKLVVLSILGLLVTGAGLQYHEEIDKLIGKLEITAGVPAAAAEPAKTAPAPTGARTPAAVDAKATAKATAENEWSESEINHLQKLVQRKETEEHGRNPSRHFEYVAGALDPRRGQG